MIGILKNTSAGWFVQYSVTRDEITSGYDSLPLHPGDIKRIQKNSQRFDNTEARIAANPIVNFEIVEVNVDTGALEAPHIGVKYAKLIPINEQTNGERFDEFMRTVEGYPELEGTMNLCNDIIEKRTGKMTEEEWQAAERAQTASHKSWEGCDECCTPKGQIKRYVDCMGCDKNPKNNIKLPTSSQTEISDEEIYKASFTQPSPLWHQGFTDGAKWYREQLKKKQ